MDGRLSLKVFSLAVITLFSFLTHASDAFQFNVVLNANQTVDAELIESVRKNCREILALETADVQIYQQSAHVYQIHCFPDRQPTPYIPAVTRPVSQPEVEESDGEVERISNTVQTKIVKKVAPPKAPTELHVGLSYSSPNYEYSDGSKLDAAFQATTYHAQLLYRQPLTQYTSLGFSLMAGSETFSANDRTVENESTFRKAGEVDLRRDYGLVTKVFGGIRDRSGISKVSLEAITMETVPSPYAGGALELPLSVKPRNEKRFGVEGQVLLPVDSGAFALKGGMAWKLYAPLRWGSHHLKPYYIYTKQDLGDYQSSIQAFALDYSYMFGGL